MVKTLYGGKYIVQNKNEIKEIFWDIDLVWDDTAFMTSTVVEEAWMPKWEIPYSCVK